MSPIYQTFFLRFAQFLRRSFNALWLVIIAGYLMVAAGQAVYRNYQSQQDTQTLRNQLQQANQEKTRLQALLVYYRTDSFKEKELRRTLLLQKPGEKVYALPESGIAQTAEEAATSTLDNQSKNLQLPIWQQWVNYLLHRDS